MSLSLASRATEQSVYYLIGGGISGHGTVTATGGSGVTLPEPGPYGINKVTVSAAAAATTNTLTISGVGAGGCSVIGIDPWLSHPDPPTTWPTWKRSSPPPRSPATCSSSRPCPPPPATSNRSLYEPQYAAALQSYCAGAGIPYLDLYNRWGGCSNQAALSALGYYADTVHPSNIGAPDIAQAVALVLAA